MTADKSVNLTVEILRQNAVIRLVRPEIKNPLSIETLEELKKVFAALESNSYIRFFSVSISHKPHA